jgi:hypothetical protein
MENEVVAPDTVETPAPETQAVEAPQTAPAEPQSRADTIREALTKTPTNRGKHAATQPREGGKFAPKFPTCREPKRLRWLTSLELRCPKACALS